MLGRGTCKRWQKSVTSKLKAYTGEWVLLCWRGGKGNGCAGGSREVRQGGNVSTVSVECAAARTAWVKLPLVVKMMLERHESKKDAAVAASTPGRAISERTTVPERMSRHTRLYKKVCDRRGGGEVREQRRHRHRVGWEKDLIV